MSHRFDSTEFKEWCMQYLLEDDMQVDYESEVAMDAFFLDCWCEFKMVATLPREVCINTRLYFMLLTTAPC